MNILRATTDYALRALLELSIARECDVSCAKLAKSCGTPKTFTYKVLRRLVLAGLVSGRAGRAGGYRLGRDPASITLLDAVDAMQGPLTVSRCVVGTKLCRRRRGCPLSKKWAALQQSLANYLREMSLADLVGALGHPSRAGMHNAVRNA
ncbi:MAG: Rrf2 family transcriptional regulator [Planctomycetes bacterium]|nr:Rrf2 family transcriptional regulator [Planctomycetota bacterium]